MSSVDFMKSYRRYKGNSPQRKKKPWLTALLVLLFAGVLVFAALEVYIGIHSRGKIMWGDPNPQVMVIFGCQVRWDGPSILLRDRLDTALNYLEDHPDIKIVVSGGKGDDEHLSEAQAMYDYLTAHGVDGANIYMEDQSRNTWQNINYTFALMERENLTGDVLLVSNGFHLARIEMLWNRARDSRPQEDAYFLTLAAPCSHTPSRVQMFFREPLALVKSFLFDR